MPDMSADQQRDGRRPLGVAALCLMAGAAVGIVALALSRPGEEPPEWVQGPWDVVNLDGGSRQVSVRFNPDGTYDDGDFVGRWKFADGVLTLDTWQDDSSSFWSRDWVPQVSRLEFVAEFDARRGEWTLVGNHALLLPSSSGSGQ